MSFWANKLNGTPTAPIIPSRDMFTMLNPVPTQPQVPQQQSIPEYTPRVRMTQGGFCPGCGSENYMPHPPGNPERTIACSECGYNPRFQQSTYGLPTLAGDKTAPVRAARQTNDSQTMQGAMAMLQAGGGDHIQKL